MPHEALPPIGLGTFSPDNRPAWRDQVATALDLGYRHIDTAQVYGNEEYVGEAIADSSVPRDEIFLSTKTVHHDVPPTVEEVPEAIDGCLERLGVSQVDMLYVHWPSGMYEAEPVLDAYNEAYADGKLRYVGLSNFTPSLIDEALDILEAPLLAHQAEMHPFLPQRELIADAQERGIWFVAYSPLAKGRVFDHPTIVEIAERHDVTPAQVTLAWEIATPNVRAIPKASNRAHQSQNLAAADLELTDDELAAIDAIKTRHRVIDAAHGPWNW